MKITLSLIKADVGSIGGHCKPSLALLESVRQHLRQHGTKLDDWFVSHTGGDIAILMVHRGGEGNAGAHQLAYGAFERGRQEAMSQGLCGARDAFGPQPHAGDLRALGFAVAELEFEHRGEDAFVVMSAVRAGACAFNTAGLNTFGDPLGQLDSSQAVDITEQHLHPASPNHSSGVMFSPTARGGVVITVRDVLHTPYDRVLGLRAPEELYELVDLLGNGERFVIETVECLRGRAPVAVFGAARRRTAADSFRGEADPVAIIRTGGAFPSTEQVLRPFESGQYDRSSVLGPRWGLLIPVPANSGASLLQGVGEVSAQGFSVSPAGKLTEAVDLFGTPIWDRVRDILATRVLADSQRWSDGLSALSRHERDPYAKYKRGRDLASMFARRRRTSPTVSAVNYKTADSLCLR